MAGGKDVPVMRVVNTSSPDLASTNCAYCSRQQLALYKLPKESQAMVRVNDYLVFKIQPHDSIQDGALALNGIQRRCLKVSTGDSVTVERYVLPLKFDLVLIQAELDFVSRGKKQETVDATIISKELTKRFSGQVLTTNQKVSFEYLGTNFTFNVVSLLVAGQREWQGSSGLLTGDTVWQFETPDNSGIKIVNQKGGQTTKLFKTKDFNFQKLGIGGLDAQFDDIFRRAFASRAFPPNVISKLGIPHVKGILLFGPPGTGKTLIARQIGKLLNGREPKVVNGPEVLSKFVGETEKNVRDLFADAEAEQKSRGDESELHIIIFDELDAICKQRGSTRDGTGVHDSIVNQLLTKIDGVEALNNILLIGMTNRKDLLDEALLRPGRMEVQIEIGLPDEKGRVQILSIHSNKMKENSFLSADVNLEQLASQTKNFSGAELEGLVKSATSFALNRNVNLADLSKPLDEDNIKVTMDDFLKALDEVKPAFGAAMNTLEMCRPGGMLPCGQAHHQNLKIAGPKQKEKHVAVEEVPARKALISLSSDDDTRSSDVSKNELIKQAPGSRTGTKRGRPRKSQDFYQDVDEDDFSLFHKPRARSTPLRSGVADAEKKTKVKPAQKEAPVPPPLKSASMNEKVGHGMFRYQFIIDGSLEDRCVPLVEAI